ncbi:helix-turn-helix domain-containing protein [Nocardiopsis sp. RV163]
MHVHRLRRELGPAGGLITTVRRVGYVYEGAPAPVSAAGG